MTVLRIGLLVVGWVLATAGWALDPDRLPTQYLIDHFDREDGLPSDTTWVAREGPRGFLWIGTRGGLARFDGSTFRVYNSRTHDAFGFSDVRDLAWTNNGDLWIATFGGGALRMRGEEFEVFDRERGLTGDEVYQIHLSSDGSVWFATLSGVSRLRDGAFKSWTAADGLAADRTIKIAESDDGRLWFSSLTGGLSVFDGENFLVVDTGNGLDSPQVHLLTRDKQLGIIAGTADGALLQLADEGMASPIRRRNRMIVEELLRDRDGNLWIGSYGTGLWRLTADGREDNFALGDAHEHVFDLYEDVKGNLWVSTTDGLLRVRDSKFLALGNSEGLADTTFVVTEDSKGRIWAGTEGRGLFRIGRDGRIDQPVAELSTASVSALLPDAKGGLWVGTFGDGLYRVQAEAIEHYGAEAGLSGIQVVALEEGRDGQIYVGTNQGTDRFDTATGRAKPIPELAGRKTIHLRLGRDGSLWASGNRGLIQYKDGEVRRWTTDDGLPADLVSATHEDERGVIWVLTRDAKLTRLDGDSLFTFRDPSYIPLLSAFMILEDSARTLWISGPEGLVALPRDDLDAVARGEDVVVRPQHYVERDGLRSAYFLGGFQPAAWAASDNRLWFATSRGLTNFDPRDLVPRAPRLTTFVDQVRLNGEVLPVRERMQLPASFDSLEIDYTTPELASARAVSFRYRILPDGSWVDAGSRRTAYFSSLPAGDTQFQVQARMGAKPFALPGEASATLALVRRSPWHESTWALLAALLALIAFLITSQRLMAVRARRRELQLKQLVDRRTGELREALIRVQTHSRIDSLTGLANRRHLDERLRAIWNLALRSGRPVSAVMIDTDFFKEYNDSLGHSAGDECLRRIGSALREGLTRDHDIVARYGGDEFLIVLYDSDEGGTELVAQRVLERVRDLKLPHPGNDVEHTVTVTAGFCTLHAQDGQDPYVLIEAADKALYQAKRAGRNRIAGGVTAR